VVAVYKELLKTYKPQGRRIFGTSAERSELRVAVRLSSWVCRSSGARLFLRADRLSRRAELAQIFALDGFPGELQPLDPKRALTILIRRHRSQGPVLSPLSRTLKESPTLLVTSTRDLLLSDTPFSIARLLRAGNDAQLIVFEPCARLLVSLPVARNQRVSRT